MNAEGAVQVCRQRAMLLRRGRVIFIKTQGTITISRRKAILINTGN